MTDNLKDRMIGATGSISGLASIMGSWQVCHNICLGLIAVLGIIGITLTGMPLLFLTKVAKPLWLIAVALLFLSAFLYQRKKCISKNLVVMNSGLILAGFPFSTFQNSMVAFWIAGGMIAVYGLIMLIREKRMKKVKCHE